MSKLATTEAASDVRMPVRGRIEILDLARGAALVAMVIYHFTWDLEFFGYIEPGTAQQGGWRLFARSIASSFLFLVGVSLYLAQGRELRLRPFVRRLAMIAAAALLITVATRFATPGSFIFFGILHHIALASLLGLAFLRLPALLVICAAIVVVAAPHFLRAPVFDHPALWWVGLSATPPRSSDYVPLFPWFGAVLFGIAGAKIATGHGIVHRLQPIRFREWSAPVQWAGRHSLAFYLAHQPILIAGLFLFSLAFPAAVQAPETAFLRACEEQCVAGNGAEFCGRYCTCMIDRIEEAGRLDEMFAGSERADTMDWLNRTAGQCTLSSLEEEGPLE